MYSVKQKLVLLILIFLFILITSVITSYYYLSYRKQSLLSPDTIRNFPIMYNTLMDKVESLEKILNIEFMGYSDFLNNKDNFSIKLENFKKEIEELNKRLERYEEVSINETQIDSDAGDLENNEIMLDIQNYELDMEYMADLDLGLEDKVSDSEWIEQARYEIEEVFIDEDLSSLSLRAQECGSSLCKLEVDYMNTEADEQLGILKRKFHWARSSFIREDKDFAIIYLER